MHWDFYTVLSVLSGIVLIAAALGGPVVGTPRERLGIFAIGAFSFAYGIWVATQVSGFFVFSVAPAALAAAIIIRAVQHAGQKKPQVQQPSRATSGPPTGVPTPPQPNRTAPSALRAAQPERIRQAVHSRSTAFCPAFQLPGAAGSPEPAAGGDYCQSEPLALGWSLADGRPRLPAGEEILGIWQATARLKVAIGNDLNPARSGHGISWVTVLDGTGLIALSRIRMMGIVVRGDSLLGPFERAGTTGAAFWSMPLRRFSAVSVTPVGHGEGLMLSSSEPAGHLTLTAISAAGLAGGQTVTAPPQQVAEMINRVRAELANPVSR
jgi:hypothetical protein